MKGWVKLHRKIWANPRSRDPEWVAVWLYLLVHAAYEPTDGLFKGKRIILEPGQLVTSQRELATETGVNLSKVNRVIKLLESETQLKQETSNVNSLISILNWEKYQGGETQSETPVKHKRNASETPPILDIGIKNVRKEEGLKENKTKEISERAIAYLNRKIGSAFKPANRKTLDLVQARLNDGFVAEDFKTVIDKKVLSWKDDSDMSKFLRPITLFGTKFESYLNEIDTPPPGDTNQPPTGYRVGEKPKNY